MTKIEILVYHANNARTVLKSGILDCVTYKIVAETKLRIPSLKKINIMVPLVPTFRVIIKHDTIYRERPFFIISII